MREFEKGGAGSFTTRVTSDTSIVSTAFSSTLTDFVGGFTVIIGALIYMAVVDWKLLLVVVAVLLVALVIIVVISSSCKISRQTFRTILQRSEKSYSRRYRQFELLKLFA